MTVDHLGNDGRRIRFYWCPLRAAGLKLEGKLKARLTILWNILKSFELSNCGANCDCELTQMRQGMSNTLLVSNTARMQNVS